MYSTRCMLKYICWLVGDIFFKITIYSYYNIKYAY
jgi:hypothetical protein